MQKCNENAANRYSYVGEVYNIGEKEKKNSMLDLMPKEWARLHREGYIHIHDLDAYGLTYNCLTFNILKDFPYEDFKDMTNERKIMSTFEYLKKTFAEIGNEQSGGMALANFDNDIAAILTNMGIEFNDREKQIIKDCIYGLIIWCNGTHTRMGQTSYYVTLNIGLAKDDNARFLAETLIDEFRGAGDLVFKPNIVFKVKNKINLQKNDPNRSLLEKALQCTAQKMIPTYVLCDSAPNKEVDPNKLAIMGCRTRVVNDLFGDKTSIGRGNIDNISINLPRLAFEVDKEIPDALVGDKINLFYSKWDYVAKITKGILLDRFEKVCSRSREDFPINSKHHLWLEDFNDMKEVFKHGTLSLGFIGLSEAFEILTGKRYYTDVDTYVLALGFVKHMRSYCNFLCSEYLLNFSLLATSGELISGRFIDIDKNLYEDKYGIFEKGFYTNSFHVNVDSDISSFRKMQLEGLFHNVCNGGCITYLELGEAPLGNVEGLLEYINWAIKCDIHYLGFNFPKDVCNCCGASGVFDECPVCHSKDITRIRRVSGYLEILDGFTKGKKNEEKTRRAN